MKTEPFRGDYMIKDFCFNGHKMDIGFTKIDEGTHYSVKSKVPLSREFLSCLKKYLVQEGFLD